jgi:hypothetical protein
VEQETTCKLHFGKKVNTGKALLESEELLFRGSDLRLKIPFRQMSSVAAKDGWLRVSFAARAAAFELSGQAAKLQ